MQWKKSAIVMGACALFLAYAAQAQNLEDRVLEHRLANGLKILMVERHSAPTAALYTIFKAGSVDEPGDARGIAHMLEHMLFKGTKTVGTRDYGRELPLLEEIDRIAFELDEEKARGDAADKEKVRMLEEELRRKQEEHKQWIVRGEYESLYARHGGTGFNAATTRDYTIYTIELPANKLELWALLESDRLKNSVMREFYIEREAVQEERRERVDTNPSGRLFEQFLLTAFQVHPYRLPIIGFHEDIAGLNTAKAEAFFRTNYAPNNSVVAVVGDFYPEALLYMIERYFGDIPAQPAPEPAPSPEPLQQKERRVEIAADAEPEVLIGYHKPTFPHPDDYVFDMIDAVLSLGRTSRLYRNLVEKGIAASAWSTNGSPGNRYDNLFLIGGAPSSPHTASDFEGAVYREIEKLKAKTVKKKEFDRILKQVDAQFVFALDSNAGLAEALAYYEAVSGSWRTLLDWREQMHRITPEDVRRAARSYLNEANRTVAVLVKKESP